MTPGDALADAAVDAGTDGYPESDSGGDASSDGDGSAGSGHAVTVTTNEDIEDSTDGSCSLREAVASFGETPVDAACVSTPSESDGVLLSAATYCLSRALELGSSVRIRGVSTESTILDGGNEPGSCANASTDRVITIAAGVVVGLSNLTIRGGAHSRLGGGIAADEGAALDLERVVVRENEVVASTSGFGGGGVYLGLEATASLTNAVIESNRVECAAGGGNRECGKGGGMSTAAGVLVTLLDSRISANTIAADGVGAWGGGLYLGSESDLTVAGSRVADNSVAGNGPEGAHGGGIATDSCNTVTIQSSVVEDNLVSATGARGFGAGMAMTACARVTIEDSTISGNENHATAEDVGAYGGGVYLDKVELAVIASSTISGNLAEHVNEDHPAGAYGAGLYLFEGATSLVNVTVSGNRAESDEEAYGAGIFTKSGETEEGALVVHVVQRTIAWNRAQGDEAAHGGGIGQFPDGAPGSSHVTTILYNSILGSNDASSPGAATGQDCFRTTFTLGNNVVSNDSGCILDDSEAAAAVADVVDVDPMLAELSAGGHAIETHALDVASPARGISSCEDQVGAAVTTDARGVSRDSSCDSGAWEWED